MKFFIEVENGKAIQHPAFEDNLNQAFPDGIPDRFEPFERIGSPLPVGTFQKSVCTYVKNETGIWNDVWSVSDMTEEEKQNKIFELSENINGLAAANLNLATRMLFRCTADSDLQGVQKWSECINKYNSWELISVLPTLPALPKLLKKDIETGEWIEL
jgi:hypothetical protein